MSSTPINTKPERHNTPKWRVGIDLGGTKIAGIVLAPDGTTITEHRIATPQGNYLETCRAISGLITHLRSVGTSSAQKASVGIGIPGSISPTTGRVQNANSTVLNGQDLQADIQNLLGQPVRLANDANCFALSEATDGAAADKNVVFGVIAGTGLGGGVVIDGKVLVGPRATGGEWGHNPLPWQTAQEAPGPRCWCGRNGCLETWLSGPGLSKDHKRQTGDVMTAQEIEAAAMEGNAPAQASLLRHVDRFARGLAHVANILDPDVIVLGGGLSRMRHLYRDLPKRIAPHLFADTTQINIVPPRWGDASGVRGAAWLWS